MVVKALIPTWLALGFYRGATNYNYNYMKELKKHEENKNKHYVQQKKPKYFYHRCLCYGFLGTLMYVNPITILPVISKEIYRVEVNIRGLKDKKDKDDYYELV